MKTHVRISSLRHSREESRYACISRACPAPDPVRNVTGFEFLPVCPGSDFKPQTFRDAGKCLRSGSSQIHARSAAFDQKDPAAHLHTHVRYGNVTKSTIREAEAQLSLPQFFRCNRCYIVNLKYVEAYKGYDVRVNGDLLQVSRRQRKSFLDALNAYMNGDDR